MTTTPNPAQQEVSYVLTVTNGGKDVAHDVRVALALREPGPAGVRVKAATSRDASCRALDVSAGNPAVVCTAPGLAPKGVITVNVILANPGNGARYSIAQAMSVTPDPKPMNNVTTDIGHGVAAAPNPWLGDLAVTLAGIADTVNQQQTYQLNVTNQGTGEARELVLAQAFKDAVPGTTVARIDARGTSCASKEAAPGLPVITCTVPQLAARGSAGAMILLRNPGNGTRTSTAQVMSLAPDFNHGDNSVTITVPQQPTQTAEQALASTKQRPTSSASQPPATPPVSTPPPISSVKQPSALALSPMQIPKGEIQKQPTGPAMTKMPSAGNVQPQPASNPLKLSVYSLGGNIQARSGEVLLSWEEQKNLASDVPDGFVVTGPGLPPEGKIVEWVNRTGYSKVTGGYHCGCGTLVVSGIPPGQHSWRVGKLWFSRNPNGEINMSTIRGNATTGGTATSQFGFYRLMVNGLRVNRQTYDDMLNRDGWGDEIYVAAAVRKKVPSILGRQGNDSPFIGVARSDVHGDVNGRADVRVLAGTLTNDGGIKSGNTVPNGVDPSIPYGPPSRNTFPLLLWEGWLGGEAHLVLYPTIWEWDGDDKFYRGWEQGMREGGTDTLMPYRVPNQYAPGFDRPIGVQGNPQAGYTPALRAIELDAPSLEREIAGQGHGLVGRAAGTLEPVMFDESQVSGFDGNYTMYLRVERLP